jgi:hypothetical protein
MPEIENAALARDQKAGAVDDVGLSGKQRVKETGVFLRVVFQVGVLDDTPFSRGGLNGGANRRALTLIHRVTEEFYGNPAGGYKVFDDFCRSIIRTVVDDNYFAVKAFGQGRTHHTIQKFAYELFLVIEWDQNRQD